jgi:hypothetical protein
VGNKVPGYLDKRRCDSYDIGQEWVGFQAGPTEIHSLMLSGFNEEVKYKDVTYHIQTEDKGRDNPIIETLVYTGGQIVYRERNSYAAVAGAEYSEAEVADRLDAQHRRNVLYAVLGKFDERPKPLFGEEYTSERTLDSAIWEYLEKEENVEPVEITVSSHNPLQSKELLSLQVEVKEKSSGAPIAGAKLKIKIITAGADPTEIDAGKTDPKGRAQVSFTVPELGSGEALFLIHAMTKEGLGEYKEVVKPEE